MKVNCCMRYVLVYKWARVVAIHCDTIFGVNFPLVVMPSAFTWTRFSIAHTQTHTIWFFVSPDRLSAPLAIFPPHAGCSFALGRSHSSAASAKMCIVQKFWHLQRTHKQQIHTNRRTFWPQLKCNTKTACDVQRPKNTRTSELHRWDFYCIHSLGS